MTFAISPHLGTLVEPLCQATADLLKAEPNLSETDYVSIAVEDDVYDLHDGQGVALATKRFIVHCKSRDPARPCSYAMRNGWWQRVPGSRSLDNQYGFTAPPSDTTALVILASVGRNRIEFEDEIAQLEFDSAIMRFAKQARLTKGPAGFKAHHSVPNDAPAGNPLFPPMPGQRVAAWAASRSEAYALWMETSTGKTYSAIMAIEATLKPGECQMNILICPKNVRTQWALEVKRFATKRVYVVRLMGGRIERTNLLLEAFKAKLSGDYDWVLVIGSYQTVNNSIAQICAYPWDWAVTDEGHFIKTHSAQRTKACMKIRDRAKRRLTMTGTPIANQLFDIYSQLEFLGRGWSGFTSFDSFRKFYGVWEVAGRGLERLVNLRNLPLIQERLARMAFMLKKSEALPDMPPKRYDVLEVEMSPEQQEVYQALAEQLYAEIERDLAAAETEGKSITVTNVLTRLLRLSQITSGFAVLDCEYDPETGLPTTERQIDRFDPNPKLEELVRFLKEDVEFDSKVIVWCCYITDIRTIRARLELEGIKCATYYGLTKQDDRDNTERIWNSDPSLRVIVGNPGAGGVGLNLQGWCNYGEVDGQPKYTKTDTVIFYSQDWSSVKRVQGEDRPRGYVHESISGTGKREHWSIRCVDLCVPDTIDMQIRMRVTDKRANAAKIQDVREILKTLLLK